MATDNIARGLSKRNEKVLEKEAQVIIDKAVDVKLNTIETDRVTTSLGQAEDGFVNVEGIKGKTVQNLIDVGLITTESKQGNQYTYDYVTKVLTNVSAEDNQPWSSKKNLGTVKPNSVYTFVCDVHQDNTHIEIKNIDNVTLLTETLKMGRMIRKITTHSNQNGFFIKFYDITRKIVNFKLSNIMLLEGDWTKKEIPNYVEGISSAGESTENKIEILNIGKNLVNHPDVQEKNVTTYNYDIFTHIAGAGQPVPTNLLDLLPFVAEGKTYTLSYKYDNNTDPNDPNLMVQYVNKNGTTDYASDFIIQGNNSTFTAKRSSFVTLRINRNVICKVWDIQLEEGTTATEFEPYKSNEIKILLNEPLRSLPNGVCDEIIGDKLIRRVGKFVLNGSENWSPNGSNQGYGVVIRGIGGEDKGTVVGNFIVDKLRGYPQDNIYSGTDKNMFAIRGGDTQKAYIRLDETYTNSDSLKKWLSLNPVTFYCELATPITTTISLPSLKSFKNSSIYLQNSITPIVTIKYPTNLAGRVFMAEQVYEKANTSVNNYWQTLLILADRELRMKSIQPLTTNTTEDIKNKLNEIMNAWK